MHDAKLFIFVDGSFANNKDLSSQIGYEIFLADETTTDGTFTMTGNLVHWSSTKCKGVTRSVLASEIYARMVREVKGKDMKPYEKSRLVIQGHSDTEKSGILTQSPTIQRASQRLIFSIAPSLMEKGMRVMLRNITQAYPQAKTRLFREILAHLPTELRAKYSTVTIL